MESRPYVTPLPPHRGRHAGLMAAGLLAATTAAVVWTSRTPPPAAPAKPRPAAATTANVAPAERTTLSPIAVTPDVATAIVAEREVPRVVTATAPVTFDETRTHHVRIPVGGWLVKARPTSLGRVVRAGETVATAYSLDVYMASLDLLAQLRDFQSQEALDRERYRLLRWGMRQDQIARIEKSMTPTAELPIIARVTGKVVAEQGAVRAPVDPSLGDVLTLTDPTYATVYVEIPAADADLIEVGGTARVTLGNARPITAPIGYISRRVDAGKKTVRIDLHPAGIKMPPNVEATVELARTVAHGAAVPKAAIVRDGSRSMVYVVRGEVAEPRPVVLGAEADGLVIVTSGVAPGETLALGGAPTK